jgi:hypothetical protein
MFCAKNNPVPDAATDFSFKWPVIVFSSTIRPEGAITSTGTADAEVRAFAVAPSPGSAAVAFEALGAVGVLEDELGATEATADALLAAVATGDGGAVGDAAGGWLAEVGLEACGPVLVAVHAAASIAGAIIRLASRRRMPAILADMSTGPVH